MQIDFTGAAELIDSAARIIKTITEALRDSLKAGFETVDLVSARKAGKRLTGVHRRAVHLVSRQSTMLLPTAEKYVSVPTLSNWQLVRDEIQETLGQVDLLVSDLKALRGDFIIEQTYLSLLNAMSQRQKVFRQVLELNELPSTESEMDAFREFLKSYVVLVRELQKLNLGIGAYLREQKGPLVT